MRSAKQFVIKVTREVIDNAEPRNSRHCLIAEAIRSTLGAGSINVNSELIRFNLGGMRYMYPTPARIGLKVQQFDATANKDTLKPFSFQLGKNGMMSPIEVRGPLVAARKKKPRNYKKPSIRRCIRRYQGSQIIQETINQGNPNDPINQSPRRLQESKH